MAARTFGSTHGVATLAVASAAGAIVCAVAIDRPLARWLADRDVGRVWDVMIGGLEYAGGIAPSAWIGVVVLAAGAIAVVAVPRLQPWSRGWLLVASSHLLARDATAVLKVATGRLRPLQWLAAGTDDSFGHTGVAFPSGHVVALASLALPIAIAWPRARVVLVAIPITIASRVAVDMHWASDALGGLAVAAAATWSCATVIARLPPLPVPTPPRL